LPTTRSFGQLIRYIGDRYRVKVVGVDLGSASTSLAAKADDAFGLTTCADLGIGLNTRTALERIPVKQIIRWLVSDLGPVQAQNALFNKSLHPISVPQTWEDLLLEYGLAREIIRRVVAQARPGWPQGGRQLLAQISQWDLIIGAGRTLAQVPHPGYAALLLIDALEPTGVSQIALDIGGIAATLGAVAAVHPLAAAEVVENDAFLNLGTVVAPWGRARRGEVALRVKVCYQDGRVVQHEVTFGSIQMIPLEPGERATLELRPTRRFDVGLGEPGRGVTAEAEGGVLGLLIDARGRPLELPDDDADRRQLIQAWLESLGIGHNKIGSRGFSAWLHATAGPTIGEIVHH
jgi:hypothetical protein